MPNHDSAPAQIYQQIQSVLVVILLPYFRDLLFVRALDPVESSLITLAEYKAWRIYFCNCWALHVPVELIKEQQQFYILSLCVFRILERNSGCDGKQALSFSLPFLLLFVLKFGERYLSTGLCEKDIIKWQICMLRKKGVGIGTHMALTYGKRISDCSSYTTWISFQRIRCLYLRHPNQCCWLCRRQYVVHSCI